MSKCRNVLKHSNNSSRRSVTDKMATAAKPLGYFLSNFYVARIIKILKVTKHGITAVEKANMAVYGYKNMVWS